MSYEEDIAASARASAASCRSAADELVKAAREFDLRGPPEIEVRYALNDGKRTPQLDEVVAKNVSVHLEDMGGSWSLIIEGAGGLRCMVSLTSKKGLIVETEGAVRVTKP